MNNEQMTVVLGTVAMETKGEYDSSAYYDKLNTVTYNEYTYMAKRPCQNILPTNTDYWQKISGGISPADIVDNLESTATNKPLSAKQGKVLNEEIKESYIIEEITTEKIYVENNKGYVFITKVPHLDNKGELIELKHGYANDEINNQEKPIDFSIRKNATFVSNAGVFAMNNSEGVPIGTTQGLAIHNGEIIQDNRSLLPNWFIRDRYILGIKENNELVSYKGNTSSQDILDDGVIEALQSFIPILVNGANYKEQLDIDGCIMWDDSTFTETEDATPNFNKIYYTLENEEYVGHYHLEEFEAGTTYYDETVNSSSETVQRYVRPIIGQKENGDLIFIVNNGKGKTSNVGLSYYDFTTLAEYYGCKFAFVLDGGGSAVNVYKNKMLNNPTDSQSNYSQYISGLGYDIREVPDFLYFSKDSKTENDANINYLLSEIQRLNKLVNDLALNQNAKSMSTTSFYEKSNEQHIFNFNKWDNTLNKFVKSMEIFFDNPNVFKGGLTLYDVINDKNVLRIHNNASDGITFLNSKLGLMYDQVKQLNYNIDLNNLTNMFYFARGHQDMNISNTPFTSEECYHFVLWQFGWDTTKVQIAFGIAQACPLKMRVYTTSWGAWKTISVS